MMRFIIVVLSACLLNCGFALPAPAVEDAIIESKEIRFDGSADWSKVVGGASATSGQFPHMASLRRSDSHICGAAILSRVYLLSAAHCTVGVSASSLTAVVGTTTLSSGGTSYDLDTVYNHPNYTTTTVENDICIVKTADSIVGSSTVASIPISSAILGGGVTATLSGWGRTSGTATSLPNDLQFIDLRTIDNTECEERNGASLIFPSSLCTLTQAGEGSCNGDSGGPLVANGILVGVVSWTPACGGGYPDVFARVSYYVPWIQATAT